MTESGKQELTRIASEQISELFPKDNPIFNTMAYIIERDETLSEDDRAAFHNELLDAAINHIGILDIYHAALEKKMKEAAAGVKW